MKSPPSSISNYVGSSLLLFVDQVLVASGNWAFWIVISRVASVHEIGQSTTVYSLVLLVATITQLGLEYPLLKRSAERRSDLFLTVTIIELSVTLVSIPFMIYALQSLYDETLERYVWLATAILVFSSLSFVVRFSILGVYHAKTVLIIDFSGTIAKFVAGYILVSFGYGTFGILVSFLIQFAIISFMAIPSISKNLGFRIGNLGHFKEVIKDGLTNSPSKFSRTIIFSLSVVLLASFGLNSTEVATFYICLMISIVAGSLASSMAYMVIPPTSSSTLNLSEGSMRLGLSLTAPLVALLMTDPGYVLSLIGDYSGGTLTLLILSLAILPSSLVMICISHLNNRHESKKIILLGTVQIVGFFTSFYIFVPLYNMNGGALAMLIAYIVSTILALQWSPKYSVKYFAKSYLAILIASTMGSILIQGAHIHPVLGMLVSVIISLILLLLFKNLNTGEVVQLTRSVANRIRKNNDEQ